MDVSPPPVLHVRNTFGAWAAIVVALALVLTACGDGADDVQAVAEGESELIADYPEWLEYIYPPPDSENSATQAVQVRHGVIAADRQVRLILDGTDVTAYSTETSPGLLEYDVDAAEASPVELDPGEHSAVVEVYRVKPGASEGVDSYDPQIHEVIDRYRWEFTVL